jgi:ADP-heptose:LPS heptosyltransferase
MPPEKVRPLLERAREVFPTYEFVLSAAPAERSRAMSMIAGMANARIESELSAQALLCLLQGATLVVAVASGIAHLAAHLDAPLIALSNLSDPYWLPTYNSRVVILADREHCRCRGNKSGDCSQTTADGEVFRCLYYIPTDRIVDSMQSLLAH